MLLIDMSIFKFSCIRRRLIIAAGIGMRRAPYQHSYPQPGVDNPKKSFPLMALGVTPTPLP